MTDRIVHLTANPNFAVAGVLLFGCGHWLVNRQVRKMLVLNFLVICGTLACVVPGLIVLGLSMYEAHVTASRLATGQSLHKNGYATWFCYRFACLLDSRAVYERTPTPVA
jgi:hypothetical protein